MRKLFIILGELCNMPNGQQGVCQVLPKCLSLLNLYQRYPNDRYIINTLVQSQRNCGSRSVNRNPILCCQDNVVFVPDNGEEPEQPPPTNPPPPPTTTTSAPIEPTTTFTLSPPVQRADSCSDPNGSPGTCLDLRSCQSVLSELLKRPTDTVYRTYVQRSNAACQNNGQTICCPNDPSAALISISKPSPPLPPPVTDATPRVPKPSGNKEYQLLTPETGCGYSNKTFNRVVGGKPAVQEAWPWMALLGYTDKLGETAFKCGGSMITSRHILTAAHCLRSDLTTVRLGEHDLAIDTEAKHLDVPIVKVAKHPDYDKRDGHSDLAVLTMEYDVPFTSAIKPICLPIDEPLKSRDFTGYQPFVAGWGKTQEGGKSANVLQQLQLPVLANSKCVSAYRTVNRLISEKQFDNAVLCAGYLKGGRDTCQGDSGGPLMQPLQAADMVGAEFYQIGIVSYGVGCARADIPGVYTRVSNFLDWIATQINEPV